MRNLSDLLELSPGLRSKILYLDANCGFGQRHREYFCRHLDDRSLAAARSTMVSEHADPSFISDFEFSELISRQKCAVAETQRLRTPRVWLRRRGDEALLHPLKEGPRLNIPLIPWSDRSPRSKLDAFCSVTSSPRTVGWHFPTSSAFSVKNDYPPEVRGSVTNSRRFSLVSTLRRLIMSRLYDVDTSVDAARIREADVIHSLAISSKLEEVVNVTKTPTAFFQELAGLIDCNGYGCILRGSEPFPPTLQERATLPYVSLVGERLRKKVDVFELLVRSSGRRPSDLAIECALVYLVSWYELLFRHKIILTTPHAQNAHLEFAGDLRPSRLVIQDMRDIEEWNSYQTITSAGQTLSSIDATYLRYQMSVHRIYFDSKKRGFDSASLAEGVFNYSFQMLRNYVLRGFELTMLDYGREETLRYKSCIDNAVFRLGRGEDEIDVRTKWDTSANTRSLVGSWRQMRARWLQLALEQSHPSAYQT